MEKVQVVKPVAGILKVGDILVSPVEGADFCLEEVNVTSKGSSERFVSLDYITVSENIPQFFIFITDEFETVIEEDNDECGEFNRSRDQVNERYEFYRGKFEEAGDGTEAQIVYRNLMWFIEWLYGQAELIK